MEIPQRKSDSVKKSTSLLLLAALGGLACPATLPNSEFTGEGQSDLGASPFCPERRGDCDRSPENGCETDLSFDVENCGLCSNSCERNNYEAMCNDGRCDGRCEPHFCDADGDPQNGCEKGPFKEKEPKCL
jgi:hypothetical protein